MIQTLTEQDTLKYWNLQLQTIQMKSEAFVATFDESLRKESPAESIIEFLSSHTKYTFGVYNERAKLLGVVTLLIEEKVIARHKAYIVGMYVDVENRRKGYARNLLQAVIEKAREIDIEQLYLRVVSKNKTAKKLYRSIGFKTYALEKKSLKTNDGYSDEEYMVLFL